MEKMHLEENSSDPSLDNFQEENSTELKNKVPFLGNNKDLNNDEYLDFSNDGYKMLYRLNTEYPSLSIDFVNNFDINNINNLKNKEYPLTLYSISGSQADTNENNKIYCMKYSNLEITQNDDNESADEFDLEAQINTQYLKINSSINRLKTMKNTGIVGLWSENRQVLIYDFRNVFLNLSDLEEYNNTSNLINMESITFKKEFLNQDEGFGINWSELELFKMATGSCDGLIYLYYQKDDNISDIIRSKPINIFNNSSVEDIHFSPKDVNVLAACSSNGEIKIMDLRTDYNKINHITINASKVDINVMSWNKKINNLIISGDDEGAIKVWDLRYQGKDYISYINWHNSPITSIEWNPNDDYTFAASANDNKLSLWDLSVEQGDENDNNLNVPDQMLFLHQGQDQLKELKWNHIYNNVILSTSNDGVNIFEPNLDEMDEENNNMNLE